MYNATVRGKPSYSFPLVWKVVAEIPKGKVTTYGEIARLCGFPGQARLVGYALNHLPDNTKIPWHRVINSLGKISFPPMSVNYRRQKKLLQMEGVKFIDEKADLQKYGWLHYGNKPSGKWK